MPAPAPFAAEKLPASSRKTASVIRALAVHRVSLAIGQKEKHLEHSRTPAVAARIIVTHALPWCRTDARRLPQSSASCLGSLNRGCRLPSHTMNGSQTVEVHSV